MSPKYARYERCPSPGCSNYAPKGKLCNQCQTRARNPKRALGPYYTDGVLTREQIQELQAEVAREYWRHPNPDKEKK